MVKNLKPYQVNVLKLPETMPWKIVKRELDAIQQASTQPWHPWPEASSPYFFARESCREDSDAEKLQWQNPPDLNLYWFRWVLSHHIIFLGWHRIATAMAHKADSHKTLGDLCVPLIKLCSLMLLYAASCPNPLYKKHIRTFMALYHTGFTAKWALEYHAYKIAIEKVLHGALPTDTTETLRSAYYEHKMVHMAVAKKFMGNAPSLLKMHTSAHTGLGDLTPETQFVYDSFFLVKRVEIPAGNLAASFRERLQQMQMDLQFNFFFPEDKVPKIFLGQRKIMMILDKRDRIIKEAEEGFLTPPL